MTALRFLGPISLLALATSCANPLNQVTSDQYSQTCVEAERKGEFAVAEEACYRALVNVDLGNLGEVEKSQKMYNLARIKRATWVKMWRLRSSTKSHLL